MSFSTIGDDVGVSRGRAESIRSGVWMGDGDSRSDATRGEEGGLHLRVACVNGGGEPLGDDGLDEVGEGVS